MAEVFEDSYSAEALANMENYIISFGTMIKEVGSSDAFKNALFGLKVMIDKKPRRVADLSKIYTGRACLLYTSPSPRDISGSRMPSSA